MEELPSWLVAAFHKRVDVWEQRIQEHPKHKITSRKADELFESLQSSFSEEQHRRFSDWEEMVGYQDSKEREEMYMNGLLDGFQLYASMQACIRKLQQSENSDVSSCLSDYKPS